MFNLSASNKRQAKKVYLTTYNVVGLLCSLFLIYKLTPEAVGYTDPLISGYANHSTKVRLIFRISELLVLLEVVNHLA